MNSSEKGSIFIGKTVEKFMGLKDRRQQQKSSQLYCTECALSGVTFSLWGGFINRIQLKRLSESMSLTSIFKFPETIYFWCKLTKRLISRCIVVCARESTARMWPWGSLPAMLMHPVATRNHWEQTACLKKSPVFCPFYLPVLSPSILELCFILYGMNVWVSPKFICWRPQPQCDCIWRSFKVIMVKWGHKGGGIWCDEWPYKKWIPPHARRIT